tara:strand:+ start:615 stop:743 length:129 start_codon:yes stop_codon:yes gene_type:complete
MTTLKIVRASVARDLVKKAMSLDDLRESLLGEKALVAASTCD